MSSSLSTCKGAIRRRALELGASACGFAVAGPVDESACRQYESWIAGGSHGTMQYCEKYADVRRDPRLLLPGANTVICLAFNYYNPQCGLPLAPKVARYAWGDDYHYALKARLSALADYIMAEYGGECRGLVDTAPMRERYWAVKSGIGFVGINNQLIVPGVGSWVFLAELLWTGTVEPDAESADHCRQCMACVRACPGLALDGQGGCDARRCVSYLTIEHRGDIPSEAALGGCIYGCDACQRVCPHNADAIPTAIEEFKPVNPLLSLTLDDISRLTPSQYKKMTRHSAMRRVPFSGLLRNISYMLTRD